MSIEGMKEILFYNMRVDLGLAAHHGNDIDIGPWLMEQSSHGTQWFIFFLDQSSTIIIIGGGGFDLVQSVEIW